MVKGHERALFRVDRVINASGLSTLARDNALLRQMLDAGLASEHALGGLRVDPNDLTVLDVNNARMVGLKCVGAMTYGDFYAVGNVDVVRWQARLATRIDLNSDHYAQREAESDFKKLLDNEECDLALAGSWR